MDNFIEIAYFRHPDDLSQEEKEEVLRNGFRDIPVCVTKTEEKFPMKADLKTADTLARSLCYALEDLTEEERVEILGRLRDAFCIHCGNGESGAYAEGNAWNCCCQNDM